ncbi:hypothetical protein N7467_001613 [Penicillium canescens]|nr:hypothetical protein N7467_001613 [Penicillium canescens]
MLMKNILATFTLAGLAIATPVEDIEARALTGTCGKPTQVYCCTTASPLNIFFIRGVGSGCVPAPAPVSGTTYTCPPSGAANAGRKSFLCCSGNQIKNGQDVVCTV